MRERRILFLFAHQDDEIGAAVRILEEVRSGTDVRCVFLTDGSANGIAPAVRDAESREVVSRLGVAADSIAFLGSRLGIPDGFLVGHLDRAHEHLDRHLRGLSFDDVFCPAWEGGHQDHDATHILALAFAASRGVLDRCWEIPLYHGFGAPAPFFRVFSPLRTDALSVSKVRLRDGMRIASLVRFYRSQWRSWLGLLPGVVLHLVVLGRITMRRIDGQQVHERPHEGRLLYERRFKFPYERFMTAAQPFVARHLPR